MIYFVTIISSKVQKSNRVKSVYEQKAKSIYYALKMDVKVKGLSHGTFSWFGSHWVILTGSDKFLAQQETDQKDSNSPGYVWGWANFVRHRESNPGPHAASDGKNSTPLP